MATKPRFPIRRLGLSIIELSVVITVVAILLALFVPAVQRLREVDARTQCISNMKQIAMGVHNFEGVFKRMPPLNGGSGGDIANSLDFPSVWGSTHVFLLPFIEQDNLYKKMAQGTPAQYDPAFAMAQNTAVVTFVCPEDPSMSGGIVQGGSLGGSSYAANAQLFAPLADETITGGKMHDATRKNFTDRGVPLIRSCQDGSTVTYMFTHAYALCGGAEQGTAWGYGAGVGKVPEATNTFQPWSRASYLKQTYLTAATKAPFQNQPNPYMTACVLTDPATPHKNAMIVAMAGGAVHVIAPSISPDTWNKACLPNDGNPLPADWGN
jgi:hypothetical protein